MVNGDENPLCTAALSELPGYSTVLRLCPGTARYITLQSPNATALDVCTLSVYAQSALSVPLAVILQRPSPTTNMLVAALAFCPDLEVHRAACTVCRFADALRRLRKLCIQLTSTSCCPAAAPAADVAVSPGSQPFNIAAGPVSAPSQAALQAPAPAPVANVPPQAQVATVFRLALIGT